MAARVFDEMLDWRDDETAVIQAGQALPGGLVRPHYRNFSDWLARQSGSTMANKRAEADLIFRRVGITFAVYGDKDESNSGTERTIPFDVIPRIFPASEWAVLDKGLRQRVAALNRFVHDIYHGQDIIRAA